MDPPKNCPGPVYRIMTQCWQHCPEHRPNFSTILERINYCSQDPDVINTPLPVEYTPTAEDDGGKVIRPPNPLLLSSHPVPQDPTSQLGLSALGHTLQPTKPRLLLQKGRPVHHEVTSCREALEPSWAEPVPAPCLSTATAAAGVFSGGHWLHPEPPHHRPCTRNGSSSGSQRLKNKTKNLWNPTYGSWVLESFRGKKALAHTQSMPLSTSSTSSSAAPQTGSVAPDGNDGGCDGAAAGHLGPSGLCSPSTQPSASASNHRSPAGGATRAGMDLAKLQSFPCGNVNYAYDEQSYETESLPLVKPKAPDAIANTSSAPSVSTESGTGHHAAQSAVPKLQLKRHASYGHEDVRKHAKAEKPISDRDSGFSLSEDLSVTPM